MSRPCCRRRIASEPSKTMFDPRGTRSAHLAEVVLNLDEFESVRLVDLLGLYHEQAAGQMHVSRQTLGRILEHAHKKIADVLVNGKALRIEGGCVDIQRGERKRCPRCRCEQMEPVGDNQECPYCRQRMQFR